MFLALCWPLVPQKRVKSANVIAFRGLGKLCQLIALVWYNLTGFEKHNLGNLELRCLCSGTGWSDWLPVSLPPCLHGTPVPPPIWGMFPAPPAFGIDIADDKVTFRPQKLVTWPKVTELVRGRTRARTSAHLVLGLRSFYFFGEKGQFGIPLPEYRANHRHYLTSKIFSM